MKILVPLTLVLLFIYYDVEAQITDPTEIRALEEIRRNLMGNLNNWDKGEDPCVSNWTGVICFDFVHNDGYLHVRELLLLNMNLSGSLSPDLGKLSYLKIMDFMWNSISGSIPKEIGNIAPLELLLLNGNQLTGSLPEELGFLSNLDRIQIDQNFISGSIPQSFAKLKRAKHFHMNNNSISGEIPTELSELPILVHLLLDNNNLSGYLPPELYKLPKLRILQLDNNHFEGTIPDTYGNMSELLKLSLRNCSLQGEVPELSKVTKLLYLDLSWNQLKGVIPSPKISENITTIDLSYNNLSGPLPAYFSVLPKLQRLSLGNNSLNGAIPSNIWQHRVLSGTESLTLDFQNNAFSNISGSFNLPANVTVRLQGNPVCEVDNQLTMVQSCRSQSGPTDALESSTNSALPCCPQIQYYEHVKDSPGPCFCAVPLEIGFRLKSPGFSNFLPFKNEFKDYLTRGLIVDRYQLSIVSFMWEAGPRLNMYLKVFPEFNNHSNTFNESELRRMRSLFTEWTTPDSAIFGPHELLNFTLLGPYASVVIDSSKSGMSKGIRAGILLGAVASAIILSASVVIFVMRQRAKKQNTVSRRRQSSRAAMKIDGVKGFTVGQMVRATNNFSNSTLIGQGGYGKVYKGILGDGTVVAVKRALEGSLQGEEEFLTEIELLSRVHHRNLVSLIGYCDDKGEQMLVYEFMENGTLRGHLSGKSEEGLNFATRLRIALDSAKGILYLHNEANPPIFHRDIKASNILLDSRFTAKVADFGLSKLAPVPDLEGTVPGYVSTVVKGTPGYLDPEYFLTHKLTDKSDVYSLGVVFLELITGMHAISHGKNIVREVNLAYKSETIFSMIDGSMGTYPSECVDKFVTLALRCCQDETDARPSMRDVVWELESIWFLVPESDKEILDSVTGSSASSILSTGHPYVSTDASGSQPMSGVISTITPR
ncbi:hypothetical protein ACHQM5_009146 [Ranunculus cassubicifolius]